MKQTNNAIKFLMAQYRAIFNNAYFKGLATAALVTVAMSAGQAQAADGLTGELKANKAEAVEIEVTSGDQTLDASSNKYALGITVTGGKVTTSGDLFAKGDLTVNNAELIVSGGSILLGHDNDKQQTPYVGRFESNSGTLTLSGGNIGVVDFALQNGTITLTSGGVGSTNLTAYGEGGIQTSSKPIYSGNANSSLTNMTATLDTATNITSIGVLSVDSGTIALNGNHSNVNKNTDNLTYLSGAKELKIQNKAVVNVSGATNALHGKSISIKDSTIKLSSGDLTIGSSYDLYKSVSGDSTAPANAGSISLNNVTLEIASGKNLNFGYGEDTATTLNITGGKITNSGTVNLYASTATMTNENLHQFVAGKFDVKRDATINITDDLDLTKDVLNASGTAESGKLTLTGNLTLDAGNTTLGKKFDVEKLSLDTDTLKVGEGFTQNKGTINVAKSLSGSKGFTVDSSGAAANFNLVNADATAGTISGIETLTVKATDNSATLNIEGKWSGLDTTAVVLQSGGTLNLKGVDALTFKSVDVQAKGKLALDGSNLTVADAVKNGAANGVDLKNNSSVSAQYSKVTSGDVVSDSTIKNFKLDGTSKIVLTGRAEGVIEKAKLDAIKKALLGADGQGLVEIAGASLSDKEAGITGDTADFTAAQGNSGVSGIYEDKTIVGANAAVSGSNSWGSVELADTKDNLEIASGASVTLNGVGGELVTKKDGTTNGGVALTQDATLSVVGNGTLATITATENQKGKALVNANLSVTGDIGSSTLALGEVNVQGGQLSTTGNIYTNNLVVDGAVSTTKDISATTKLEANGLVQAQNITAGSITVSDTVIADKVTLSGTSSVLSVGDSANTGLVEVGTLDLKGGKLLLDPAYDQPSTIVALKDVTDTTKDVVSANGDIGVGMNSILAVGTTADEAKALLTKLDFFNGEALKQTNGAVLVANESLYVPTNGKVLLDSTADHAALSGALTTNNSFSLGANSALVVTDNLSSKLDGNKAVIQFANSTGAAVTLEKDSKIAFESALSEQDKVLISNSDTAATDNGVVITAAGGLLNGTLNGSQISFTLDEDKLREQAVNMSAPVQDLAIAALKGTKGEVVLGEAGTQYIQTMTGLDGGKAVEETARLAVYGGAVQATNLAQQAATDAVADRMSRANPNGSLVFADNAQGGGLWLSPVYKSHESDSFDADGVDYGVDADLTGLVLGGDFTSESGVRAGAYFNFGSASVDGQGVGDKVSNDADYFGFGLYAGMTFGQMSLVADAGFTQVSNDIEQTPSAKVSKVKADVDSSAVTLGLRGEYKLNVATMDVTPHLGVRYTRLAVDSYDAKADGILVANTDFDTMQMFSVPFGVTISKDIAAGSWTIKPVFDLTLTANAGDTDAKLDTTFVGTKTIGLTSEAFDSFTYGATMGIDAKYGEKFSVGLNTNYVGSSNADEFGVMGNVRYMF
ncbi:autotransporter outer membrane beta-barrel domain-containing protein [Anaerobiospirillum sp. NML120448]|uniref:autotransporter domain-containing protein n=1 Tax=Anaerobiospirillum sp. NML120448 TaxID=2932816 RepID=UPI001FF1AFC5|nr:autotransporter outer membrane beta-barrel domain-containing protein [Anaerobiospirillum sp. NML120448]MCK0514351.1 autotransporter outer membrane beta-barrel domain-containing protein [Anaerobiospirillum sp. NML120448]